MYQSLKLDGNREIRMTEPSNSDTLLTLQLDGYTATFTAREAEQVYYWLHRHRQSFIAFYGKGWNLAKKYWTDAGSPDNYYSRLELFNKHAAEIPVEIYVDGETAGYTPSDLALNGFFAFTQYQEEQESQEQPEQPEQE